MPLAEYNLIEKLIDTSLLHAEIEADPAILVALDHIDYGSDFLLRVYFASTLPADEETALYDRIGAHTNDRVAELKPKGAKILTGTYTGDGTTSQAIVAWTEELDAKFIMITPRKTTDALLTAYWTTPAIMDDNANGGAIKDTSKFEDNRIISINPDGFTVDDNSGNGDPNKSGRVYNYVVTGELL